MKLLRSDNGDEYTSAEFKAYLAGEVIVHGLRISRRLEQNGVAEHMNRTFTERAHSIKLQASMSKEFWSEAVSHACYLVNRPLFTAVDLQIPEEILQEECGLFNLTDFRLSVQFGC